MDTLDPFLLFNYGVQVEQTIISQSCIVCIDK